MYTQYALTSKCRLLQSSVQYLGHVISGKGIKTDPTKIACVANWPVPETTAELKRFLGFASYYRRFVRNFAQVTCPLNALTQQGAQWLWSEGCIKKKGCVITNTGIA